jgi:membrane protease YdiL (CAAX protease family)
MATTSRQFSVRLAVIVIVWYVGLTYLPQIVGTCFDAIPLAFIALPPLLEMLLCKKNLSRALSDIGLTRFRWTGIRITVIYLLPLLFFHPMFALLTNSPLTTQPNWQWRLLNVLLINGLAEEIMMRGFVFRHLREGRLFWRAAAGSTLYFAAYHLPLILIAGPLVGIIAVVIAIPAGFFMAYIYERGNNTIWGPALAHAVYNGLAFVFVFPADIQPMATSLYLVVGIIISTLILVFAYRAGYGRRDSQSSTDGIESVKHTMPTA